MMPYHYAWLIWSSAFLLPWLSLEELLFGFSFGLVWTGIYEHFTWKRRVAG